jgi:hypothetical protein
VRERVCEPTCLSILHCIFLTFESNCNKNLKAIQLLFSKNFFYNFQIAFVAFHFLMHLTLSLMMCVSERQKKKRGKYHPNGSNYPMHHMGYPPTRGMPPVHPYPDYEELKGDSPGGGLRKFFLVSIL